MDAADNSGVEIPSYFLCPISMQLMGDPVIVCTGVTYDRESIEKWMYTFGKNICPATMQILQNTELTPNHTLRRLIQGWCVANSSMGVQRISTPPAPLDTNQLNKLLADIENCPVSSIQMKALRKLKSVAGESETNRRIIASSDAPAVLISVLESQSAETDGTRCCYEVAVACEEALGVLCSLPLPNQTVDWLATAKCLAYMASILKRGTSNARFHAAMLLQTVSKKGLERFVLNANDALIEGLLELLTEEVCHQATKSALEILIAMTSNSRRSRIKAIEAGAVSVLIESLPDQTSQRRSTSERMLCLLDVLCGCAEGRAAVSDHATGIPAVSKKIMNLGIRNRKRCSYPLVALQILSFRAARERNVADWCSEQAGTPKTRSKIKEMLKAHDKRWKSSYCVTSIIYPQSGAYISAWGVYIQNSLLRLAMPFLCGGSTFKNCVMEPFLTPAGQCK